MSLDRKTNSSVVNKIKSWLINQVQFANQIETAKNFPKNINFISRYDLERTNQ